MENYRNILITCGMYEDYMIIRTNATDKAIKNWCINYNIEQENGENTYFDNLKKEYCVEVLADSELEVVNLEEFVIDVTFDLMDYMEDWKLIETVENVKIYKREHKDFPYITEENNCKATQRRHKTLEQAKAEVKARNISAYRYFV